MNLPRQIFQKLQKKLQKKWEKLERKILLRYQQNFHKEFCHTLVLASQMVLMMFVLQVLVSSCAFGALTPSEVAVLAIEPDVDSMRIAKHYMQVRAIPQENLLTLKNTYPTDVSYTAWRTEIRPVIRLWLAEHPKVKCIVCAWALPLRINAPTEAEMPYRQVQLKSYAKLHLDLAKQLKQGLVEVYNIAPTDESRQEAKNLPDIEKITTQEWIRLVQRSVTMAAKRMEALSENERKESEKKLKSFLQNSLGLNIIRNVAILQAKTNPNANANQNPEELMKVIQAVEQLEKHLVDLNFFADSPKRDLELLQTIKLLHGAHAMMSYVGNYAKRPETSECRSAFDSELALIFETEMYPAPGWIPNMYGYMYNMPPAIRMNIKSGNRDEFTLPTEALPAPPIGNHVTFDTPPELEIDDDTENVEEEMETISMAEPAHKMNVTENSDVQDYKFRIPALRRRVLLVSRLEGPTAEIVMKRIDEGIATEKSGLSGSVYLDARTTRPTTAEPGSYAKMEQSLNDLAIRLQRCTDLDVKLDTKGAMFQKENCPESAALYCGWYSVHNFQDIFTFNPGAVAYHVASFEADSLRTGPAWCPNLIEHGVAGTLGATFEPYLSAFPEPDEFFSLILTGRFSMVECYFYTLPFNSWAMTYVGDPLYTPFRVNPQLKVEDLPDKLQRFFGLQP